MLTEKEIRVVKDAIQNAAEAILSAVQGVEERAGANTPEYAEAIEEIGTLVTDEITKYADLFEGKC